MIFTVYKFFFKFNQFLYSGNHPNIKYWQFPRNGGQGTSPYLINNNNVTTADLSSWNVPGASTENLNTGIFINNATSAEGMNKTKTVKLIKL